MGGNLVETLIGAVVLVVAGLFLVFAYSTAGVRSGVGGYELIARFDRVDGLAVGNDVRISGIKVGTVTRQDLDPQTYAAVVRMTIDNGVKVPADSSAKIATEGLLGGSHLAIQPGGSDEVLKSGGEITLTQGAVNLLDLVGQAVFSAGGAGEKAAPAQSR
jgi:phospholipid/cholesterol/gamma-HCH transport system substrate-binding protein